jgi:hypothetical protein
MTDRWDLAAYDQNNQLILVVEVKSKLNVPPEWAARLRRNILAHGTFPNAAYFLMAFPDRFYLWKNTIATQEATEPTYVIDARPILQPYFERADTTAALISGQSLELIIASWLNELIHKAPDQLDASQQWLLESGLHDAIFGGSLSPEILV